MIGKTQVKHVVLASMGEMLGFPKGLIVDFVVRRKMVPPYSLSRRQVRFAAALKAGPESGSTNRN